MKIFLKYNNYISFNLFIIFTFCQKKMLEILFIFKITEKKFD